MGKTEGRKETAQASGATFSPPGGFPSHPSEITLPSTQKKSTLREYAETFAVAIVLVLLIRTFVVQAFKIPSASMFPTLNVGDHILVNKFIYGVRLPFTDRILIPFRTPKHGDVMVFRFPMDPSKDFIKRVIGLPGDTIEIKNNTLYRNGQRQEEGYLNGEDEEAVREDEEEIRRERFGPIVVPENAYFVMGDNRHHSLDSRFWGFVPYNKIRGEAFIIYWSWDKEARRIRLNRFGKIIH